MVGCRSLHMRLSFVHYPGMLPNFVSVHKSGIRRFVKGLRSELRISALQVAATAKSFQEMVDFDVILGMTWLSPNFAILDCNAKTVTLAKPGTDPLVWEGDYTSNSVRIISFLRAKKMVSKGCLAFLAHLKDDTTQVPSIGSVSVVREFSGCVPCGSFWYATR